MRWYIVVGLWALYTKIKDCMGFDRMDKKNFEVKTK